MKYQALTAALCLTALVGCTEGGTSGGNVQPETTTGAGSTTGNQLPPGPSTTGGGTTGSGTTGGGTTGSGTTGGGTTGGGTTGSGTTGGGNTGTLAGNMSNGANGNSLNDYWRCGESNRSESTNEYYVMLFLDDGSGAYLDSENELPFTWNTAGSTVQFVLNGDRRTFEYTSVDFYTENNFSSGFEVDGEFIENNRC
ncbi:MAG: hypothetical protein KTR35_04965, partial [Gammaproteobacteria bacterium]|nr:hypothetical protein [Gammaproteobacteria bacterium]